MSVRRPVRYLLQQEQHINERNSIEYIISQQN